MKNHRTLPSFDPVYPKIATEPCNTQKDHVYPGIQQFFFNQLFSNFKEISVDSILSYTFFLWGGSPRASLFPLARCCVGEWFLPKNGLLQLGAVGLTPEMLASEANVLLGEPSFDGNLRVPPQCHPPKK